MEILGATTPATPVTPVTPAKSAEVVTSATSDDKGTTDAAPATESGLSELKNLSDNPLIVVLEDRNVAVVELLYALGVNQEITVLNMRRPIVNDTILAEKLAEGVRGDMFIARLSNLCEVPFDEFEGLDELEDLENLTEAYALLKTDKEGDSEQNSHIAMSADRRTCEVTLQHPVQFKGAEVTKLNLRRPTLKDSTDAEKHSKYPTEVLAHKYAALCGVSVDVITQLDDIDDFANLDAAYGRFRRPKARRTSKR